MSDTVPNTSYITAEWVRRPIPDLDGMSPADAASDPHARRKLDDLLVELAGHHVRLTHLGLPAVDPQEIRKALGLAETPRHHAPSRPHRVVRPGPVKRNPLLDELGTALTGGDVDSVAYFNAKSGAVEHFMHNLGDQENARIAEADANSELTKIAPVTTDVRYGIMSDFISTVDDINIAGRLRAAISGKGAFRRFREAVDEDDALRRRWLAYRTKRHYHLALDWLQKLGAPFAQFDIKPADYDWEPPTAEPERAAPAQEKSDDEPQLENQQTKGAGSADSDEPRPEPQAPDEPSQEPSPVEA